MHHQMCHVIVFATPPTESMKNFHPEVPPAKSPGRACRNWSILAGIHSAIVELSPSEIHRFPEENPMNPMNYCDDEVNDYYQLLLSMDYCEYNNYTVYDGILYYIVIIANWQLLIVSLSWWGHGNSHQSQIRIDFFGSSFWNIQARKSRKIRWILCYGVWHLKKTYNHLLTQKFWMDVHFFSRLSRMASRRCPNVG